MTRAFYYIDYSAKEIYPNSQFSFFSNEHYFLGLKGVSERSRRQIVSTVEKVLSLWPKIKRIKEIFRPNPWSDDVTASPSVVNFTNILLAHLHQFPCTKKSFTHTSSTKKLCAKLLYEKATRKMMVKLTPAGLRWHRSLRMHIWRMSSICCSGGW